MQVAILFNPVSGQGRAAAEAGRFADAIAAAGHRVRLVASRREPAEAWLATELDGIDVLLVAGGDGAVRLAAAPAARAGVPVHHIPLGTENLFARAFGGSRTPAEAVAALARNAVREIDLGRIRTGTGEGMFALMASLGVDAAIVHDLASRRTGAISHRSYVGPVVRQGLGWEPSEISAAVDGGEWRRLGRGWLVVANAAAYALGIDPIPAADPADGRLDAAFLPCEGSLDALVAAVRRLAGADPPDLVRFAARVISVRARPAASWQLDGDPGPSEAAEASIEVARERLQVLRPA